MKKCPECDETFDDRQNFCDVDGSPLMDEITVLQTALQNAAPKVTESEFGEGPSQRFSWSAALVGVLIGIVLCLIGIIFKFAVSPEQNDFGRQRPRPISQQSSRPVFSQVASTQKPESASPPEAETTPSEESDELVSEPSPAANPSSVETVASTLNNGPVSTGTRREGEHAQTLIKLKDGSSVAADAAWEDSQGVWYRRGGLVSFVDRDQVALITDVAQPTASSGSNKAP